MDYCQLLQEIKTTMENLAQSTQQIDSEPEVQEIDPPVLVWSGRKRYRRKMLRHPIYPQFCHRSKRNKNTNQQAADILDAVIVSETSTNIESTLAQNYTSTIR
jgi:hypothetical protein